MGSTRHLTPTLSPNCPWRRGRIVPSHHGNTGGGMGRTDCRIVRRPALAVPSPRGRIALLPCGQRHIRVSRAHIPLIRHRRKQIPRAIQTIGDYIQAKRYENGLRPYQVAGKMGIAASLVSAWERGTQTPDEKQWQMLSTLLSFDSGVDLPKPHR